MLPSNGQLSNSGHFYHTNLYQFYHRTDRCSRTFEIVQIDNRIIRSSCLKLSEQATFRAQIVHLMSIKSIFVPGLSCGKSVRFSETSSKSENATYNFSQTKIAVIVLHSRKNLWDPHLKIDVQVYGGKIQPSPMHSASRGCPVAGNTLPIWSVMCVE